MAAWWGWPPTACCIRQKRIKRSFRVYFRRARSELGCAYMYSWYVLPSQDNTSSSFSRSIEAL